MTTIWIPASRILCYNRKMESCNNKKNHCFYIWFQRILIILNNVAKKLDNVRNRNSICKILFAAVLMRSHTADCKLEKLIEKLFVDNLFSCLLWLGGGVTCKQTPRKRYYDGKNLWNSTVVKLKWLMTRFCLRVVNCWLFLFVPSLKHSKQSRSCW